MNKPEGTGKTKADREQRLARALRENLRRRKSQARMRNDDVVDIEPPEPNAGPDRQPR